MSGNVPRGRGGARAGRGDGRGEYQLPFNPRGGRMEGMSTRGGYRGAGDDGGRGRGRGDGGFRGSGGFDRSHGRARGEAPEVKVYQSPAGIYQPDSEITRIENETDNAQKQARLKDPKSQQVAMPLRPGFGTKGRAVLLWTNYFNMLASKDLVLHRYSVDVIETPSARAPVGKKLKRVVQIFMETHLPQSNHNVVTDFKSNVLSRTRLELEPDYVVTYRQEGEYEPAPYAKTYRIRLQPTGTLTVSQLLDYLTSTQISQLLGSKEEIIQALNIIIGQYPKDDVNVASVGANKHFRIDTATQEKFDLGAGLVALRGYFVSVRAATARILLNVQVKHRAFFDNAPLVTLMGAFRRENGQNNVNLGKFLQKLSVEVTHIVRTSKVGITKPRIKQIHNFATRDDGRDQEHPPVVPAYGAGSKQVKFFLSSSPSQDPETPEAPEEVSGKKGKGKAKGSAKGKTVAPTAEPGPSSSAGAYITVFDYFKTRYPHVSITDPSLPVINVGTRQNPNYLPPDVCNVIAGQPSNAKLSPFQTQQMIRFAVRKPAVNAQSIVTGGACILSLNSGNGTLDAFGVNITPKLVTVPGRVLNGPSVQYGKNKSIDTKYGSWNMRDIQFKTGTQLRNWAYLRISLEGARDPWHDDKAFEATMREFTEILNNVGVNADKYTAGIHISVDPNHPEPGIDAAIKRFASNPAKAPPNFILVILPSADAAIYNRVKYACDVEKGLLNVCVVASKFVTANAQHHANIALKVNLKLGGQNQSLDGNKLGIVSEGKTMVVGIDVTHPSPGSTSNAPSVASIVASIDKNLGQWPAALSIQTGRQEMVGDLSELFKSRLRLWQKKNKKFPENILVYRDGVSEGQYNLVLEQELPALQKASQEVYPATDTKNELPRITIVVVGKRHHTRFYPTKTEDADRSSNPQNGTVVDRGVTEARNWDFFLQAHTAIQGTARPAHYYIIYDQIFQGKAKAPFANAADVLEDLTHNMCYMFGRATKAVSICPAAYYADLACERARCYLSGFYDPSTPSPGTSVVSGQTGGSGQAVDVNRVRVHDNVKDSMFYI